MRRAVVNGRGPVGRPASLDHLDAAIIAALQANGRESFRAIAARAGVSEATVRNRYTRLVEAGVLQVTAVTSPLALGYHAMAMVGVTVVGAPERVADVVSSWKEAIYVVITAGRFDLLVEFVCDDRSLLLELIGRLRDLDAVDSTETFVYLDLAKQVFDCLPRGEGTG